MASNLLFAPPDEVPASEMRQFGQLNDHFFRLTDDPDGQVFHYDLKRRGVRMVGNDGTVRNQRWSICCKQKLLVEVIDPSTIAGLRSKRFAQI